MGGRVAPKPRVSGFKQFLFSRVFTGLTLIKLVPFTQKHGDGAFELVPKFDYLESLEAKEAPTNG